MSYLVLARKSRPQTFAEVVGQKPVVRTLQNALAQQRVPHALIFSGVRGTGKTTLARIMAKALNCEQGPSAEPCNRCLSCREITDGNSIDLQEVDGASNRGIQEIRELKDKIRFMPTSSRFKIIIIDEVHMLTTEAFNALLKTLEEPPSHVYFMFATTELHKVPVTILSRCQRYELKRLSFLELTAHFTRLAKLEGVQIESEAVAMIVRESGGSVRDGLSLLDQIFSYCGQEVRASDVVEVLGLVNHQLVGQMGKALLEGDLATVYTLIDEMYRHGADNRRFSNDLLAWFRALIVCKISPSPEQLLDTSPDELVQFVQIAHLHSLETLSAYFDVLLEGIEKAAFSQQPRLALELALLRAVQFRDVVPVTDLINRIDRLLEGSGEQTAVTPSLPLRSAATTPAALLSPSVTASTIPTPAPVEPKSSAPGKEITQPPQPSPEPTEPPSLRDPYQKAKSEEPQPQPVVSATSLELNRADSVNATGTPPSSTTDTGKKRIRQNWDAFLKYVRERQPWVAASLRMAASVERKGEELIIHFNESADCSLLKQGSTVNTLAEFVLDFFQENLRIRFEVPGSNACALDPANGLAPLQERRALANDPLVLTALDVFTGQIGEIRIGKSYRGHSTQQPTDAPLEEETSGRHE